VKHPEYVDMVIFRENTEDIYTGIEFRYGTEDNKKFMQLFNEAFPKEYAKMRFPDTAAIGVKPVSVEGTERLVRAAIAWSLLNKRKSVNFVHKGNIRSSEAFKDWDTRSLWRVPQSDRDGARIGSGNKERTHLLWKITPG
jgi:isocitrate dehydrogenase